MNHGHEGHPHFMMDSSEFFARQEQAAQVSEMRNLEFNSSVNRLLDGLTAEQAITLAKVLEVITFNQHYVHILSGEVATILRIVHKVCLTCSSLTHATEDHMTSMMPGLDDASAA